MQKVEREDPCLQQLCHSLRDPSCSGTNVANEAVLSSLLWDIQTWERLSQAQAFTNSRGEPQLHQRPRPCGCLLFWSSQVFINSLVLVPNFPNQKSHLGQSYGICMLTNHSKCPLGSWKQIQNRTSEVWGTKNPPYQRIAH